MLTLRRDGMTITQILDGLAKLGELRLRREAEQAARRQHDDRTPKAEPTEPPAAKSDAQ